MSEDKPITQKQVAGCAGGAAVIGIVIAAITAIGGFLLYIMACANMPTGCH